MTQTGKVGEIRERIVSLAAKRIAVADRLDGQHRHEEEHTRRDEAAGLLLAIKVIDDVLGS